MTDLKPIAIVGLGAVLPDAHDVASFWKNIQSSVYSIQDVPQGRWNPDLYYDPDPSAPDKTYTKIGSWVQDFQFNPIKIGIPIPPKVLELMDETQQWAIAASHQALQDYGYPQHTLPNERVAVILGNALAGEKHYRSSLRIHLPEYLQVLSSLDAFRQLSDSVQQELLGGFTQGIQAEIPAISEDTMPGELSNIIAGRVANVFNFGGPNFTTDAACASSLAALQAAVDGLRHHQFDAVLTGGVDRSMSVESYVKFSKIGALSPDGSRPYADGANGFVMGEGAVVFLLKRLEDAERDDDRIYAVIRAIGSSSDGKGKGITAPNPIGQERAMERAWKLAGVSPATAGYVEGHGTSTRVGDVVEVQSLGRIFGGMGLPSGAIALGSVKSNIGHLKSAAGAVGMLKTVLALQDKVLPPMANFSHPNPKIDFANLPFRVITKPEPWQKPEGDLRRAGVSAFGFGGTNFHIVLEEYAPGVSLGGTQVFNGVDHAAVELPVEADLSLTEANPVSFTSDEILQTVLGLVSEKTGYPVEMLDPELDLEADLGVDTVKQAELFAEVRERYGIPRREDLQLSDYNTLEKVVSFVEKSLPGTPAETEEAAPDVAADETVEKPDSSAITAFILQQVSEKTGYPSEMLDLELDLEADLGIDTVKQAELFLAVREHYGIPRREDLRLSDYNTLEKVVAFVEESLPGAPVEIEEAAPDVAADETVEKPDSSAITAFILQQVSEKTGYPSEMLDLELDLEADLGIDTVKQAELFLAVREHYGIPRREDLRLSDYNTLEKVVAFVEESLPGTPMQTEETIPDVVGESVSEKRDPSEVLAFILQQVSEKTGYPAEMLDPELDLEADLGIDTVKQAELFASVREHYGIPRREDLRLSDYNTLEKVAGFVVESGTEPTLTVASEVEVPSQIEETEAISKAPDGVGRVPAYRKMLFLSAENSEELLSKLIDATKQLETGNIPANAVPIAEGCAQQERIAIDFETVEDLQKRVERAIKAFDNPSPNVWKALSGQGVYRGSGEPGRLAFLFPGQGSQYVNMMRDLSVFEPVIEETFREADRVLTPILGKPLTEYIFVDSDEEGQQQEAEAALRDTTITQPAVLTADVAMLRLMRHYGFEPEMVAGHSLGEYGALVAAGMLDFQEALEIVSARGREMSKISVEDNGCMAAVSAPIAETERVLKTIEDYVVLANINSPVQSVIGGSTAGVDAALEAFKAEGIQAVKIPVSHAFHTRIVAPASEPLRRVIMKMHIRTPRLPVAANVTGAVYPNDRDEIIDLMARQVASPVQFIQGINTLYDLGARVFIEVGPKRVLSALTSDILGNDNEKEPVVQVPTNHPRKGGVASFNEALCALYAAGVFPGQGTEVQLDETSVSSGLSSPEAVEVVTDGRIPLTGSVVISGAGLGLPGKDGAVFREDNIERILRGDSFIEPLPEETRNRMVEKRVTRLVKSSAGALMVEIDDLDQTVQLAGQRGTFNLAEEFGLPAERAETYDIATKLAIAAGIEALRDAGIPLVLRYKETSKGTLLPDRWVLPSALADETGVIFASAFPGLDHMAEETERFYRHQNLSQKLEELRNLQALAGDPSNPVAKALKDRMEVLEKEQAELNYHFDRRFIFRVLVMGHSQFAEYIGARGPSTAVNAACASTTQAVSLAEDWIRAGRCRRVVIVSGDDVTGGSLVNWVGTGMFATGATTTEKDLRLAVLPFDRRRNGMIMGMGAAALVVEAEDAVRERGMRAICEILASQTANSAFHGTRLDVAHVSQVMNQLISQAERRFALCREEIAGQTMFVSHETYTPARGGSAAAEIHALRNTFGDHANKVVIANTKGFTGHTMGVGVEDVVAVKGLEYGVVPPIAHYDDAFEPDPDLGDLNLSHGGEYPVQYALRLGAGFGSQIAMTLTRHIPGVGERKVKEKYQQWLEAVTGIPQAAVEVVQHTLRIQQTVPPVKPPAQSTWTYGQGPTAWAASLGKMQAVAPETAEIVEAPALAEINPEESVLEESPESLTPPVSTIEPESGEIVQMLLAMVSEKTGYPQEMLDMELDLEADLGVDTVKQAELFAAVREHYEIPRREDLQLSDYNTLAKVVRFVEESLAEKSAVSEPVLEQAVNMEEKSVEEIEIEEAERVLVRRVPTPVLRPRLDLCFPTGVTINEESRVIIVRDQGRVHDSLLQLLHARKAGALVLEPGMPHEIETAVQNWLAEGPVQGVFFLAALDIEASMATMTSDEWQAELDRRVLPLYSVMRMLPNAGFLTCGTRFGGLHGCQPGSATSPMGGLVSGFAKALAWERPNMAVKVVDFEEQESASSVAANLLDETLQDPGTVEVGWEDGQRFGVAALEQELPAEPDLSIEAGSIFLISGGTGGITAPIIENLARKTRGTFYLLGRTVLPATDDPDIQQLKADRNGLRDELIRRKKESGEKVTPAIVERKLAALERAAACLETMQAVEAAGGKARYLQCDVLNAQSVQGAVDVVLQTEGKVDVLIHAAGVEHSRRLENKPLEEFVNTIAVKATGFYHLFHSLAEKGKLPEAVVAFSSVAGRFGNAGQTDYAAANDLLCKMVSAIRRQHPDIKAIALDWGAWADVGMASRGFIPNLMARAGIDMLSPAEAAPQVYKELVYGLPGEAILAGSLGILIAPREAAGGLDLERANEALTTGQPIHVMLSRATGLDLEEGVILEAELDPKDEPFLRDHALNGTPLLPGVMGIEGFSVAAQHVASVLGAKKGSFKTASLEDIRFMAPFKFYRNEPRQVTWKARVHREKTGLVAYVVLQSTHALRMQPEETIQHFSGKVHLVPTNEPLGAGLVEPPHWNSEKSVKKEDIYRLYFHGPAFQVLEGVERTNGTVVGKLQTGLPSFTANKQNLVSLPLLVELCLQTAGVYEIGATGALSLPQSIGSLTLHQLAMGVEDLFAEVYPKRDTDGRVYFDARVVDGKGTVYLEMHRYQTSSMPYAADKNLVKPLEILISGSKHKPGIG